MVSNANSSRTYATPANVADFKAAISNCIASANTDKQKKLNSLLTLEFQTFQKVQVLPV
ncbi:MAG: hypothetical protein HRU34_18995 [Richelia sp.]|nr:hypothetical protein [Richelia sp.]